MKETQTPSNTSTLSLSSSFDFFEILSHLPEFHRIQLQSILLPHEQLLVAEEFPRSNIFRKLLKRVSGFIAFILLVSFVLFAISLSVFWHDFWIQISVIDLIVQCFTWILSFIVCLLILFYGESYELNESFVITNLRVIRIITPIQFTKASSESYWFNTLDEKWFQIREDHRKLACYSVLFHPSPNSNSSGLKMNSNEQITLEKQTKQWNVTREDRSGFVRMRATKDTIQYLHKIIKQYASSQMINIESHFGVVDLGLTCKQIFPTISSCSALNLEERNFLNQQLSKVRANPLNLFGPLIVVIGGVFVLLASISMWNSAFLALLIVNSFSVFLIMFIFIYLWFRLWFNRLNYKTAEDIDRLVFDLNQRFRQNGIMFLNRGLMIELKAISFPKYNSNSNPNGKY